MKQFKVIMILEFNDVTAGNEDDAKEIILEDYEVYAQPHLLADNWYVEEVEEVEEEE